MGKLYFLINHAAHRSENVSGLFAPWSNTRRMLGRRIFVSPQSAKLFDARSDEWQILRYPSLNQLAYTEKAVVCSFWTAVWSSNVKHTQPLAIARNSWSSTVPPAFATTYTSLEMSIMHKRIHCSYVKLIRYSYVKLKELRGSGFFRLLFRAGSGLGVWPFPRRDLHLCSDAQHRPSSPSLRVEGRLSYSWKTSSNM